jgi:hypothetical protein
MEGGADKGSRSRALALSGFHGVKRGRVCHGKIMQVPLEVLVRGEPETLDDSHRRGRIRAQTVSQGTYAEQDVGPRILQDGTNDFLALGAKLPKFIA